MKEPILNNCCFCWDLKKGNIVLAVLQIFYSVINIYITFIALEDPYNITQADIDELINEGVSESDIELVKDVMNIPECKKYI